MTVCLPVQGHVKDYVHCSPHEGSPCVSTSMSGKRVSQSYCGLEMEACGWGVEVREELSEGTVDVKMNSLMLRGMDSDIESRQRYVL